MNAEHDLLIIGAGPTGLSAALFLTERGFKPRIVERREAVTRHSKAFGINSRSLHLLESVGVTEQLLKEGRRLDRLDISRRGKSIATIRLDAVADRYNHMCVLGQSETEQILERRLANVGITVERGVEAVSLQSSKDRVSVDLLVGESSQRQAVRTVLCADGASSHCRNWLGIGFPGFSHEESWWLYDIEIETPLAADDGHVLLLDHGVMFMVRLKQNVWRLLGSGPDPLAQLPSGTGIGSIHWHSEFKLSYRVAERFALGNTYLAGDAAHVHAGIGARGMNLGIEDAYVFAQLFSRNELEHYDNLRRPTIERVVRQIAGLMKVPRVQTIPGRLVRRLPWLPTLVMPLVRHRIQPWVLGLDHDI